MGAGLYRPGFILDATSAQDPDRSNAMPCHAVSVVVQGLQGHHEAGPALSWSRLSHEHA